MLRIASNIVGTPCKAVHFSSEIACSTELGSNVSLGKTILDPCVTTASMPKTNPKQWKSGGGQQRMSKDVRFMRSPIKRELFTRLLWDRWSVQPHYPRGVVLDQLRTDG